MTISKSYGVSTENGWKRVQVGNLNHLNINQLRSKRLVPIEHDLINVCGLYSKGLRDGSKLSAGRKAVQK